MENLVRTLGSEKLSDFMADFDKYVDIYSKKAKEMGYEGNLKFQKERGKMIIMVEILNEEE